MFFISSKFWPVSVHEPLETAFGYEERLVLRPLKRNDQEEWRSLRYRNSEWLQPWDNTAPVQEESLTHYNFASSLRETNRTARAGHILPWGIAKELSPGGQTTLIGQLSVSTIFYGSLRSAAIGYWIDQGHAGRGLMPRAVALACDYCFTTLQLHRLEINILPENSASHRVAQKLGFRNEGIRQKYLHINGAWRDHVSYALTAEEVPESGLWARLGTNLTS